jgi:transposase
MAKSILKHKVVLTVEQRVDLERMVRQSSIGVAKKRWATILLRADQDHPDGGDTDEEIAEEVGISVRHLERIRKKFALGGFDAALVRKTRSDSGVPKVFDGPTEAQLVTLACTEPPQGRATWTLQLLCTELARLKVVTSVCPETVRTCLKKTSSSPGKSSGSASPRTTGRDSSPRWRPSSKSTRPLTTPSAR